MKIIIVGIGKLGEYLTRNLVKENNEITIIDNDYTTSKGLINNVDVNYVDGSGLDPNVLIEAGVDTSDLVISVMDKDESNIMCSLLSKKLGAKNTIARIRGLEYSNMISTLKEDLGLSMAINPELLTANNVASALSIPSILESTSFFKGKIHMVSLKVREKGKLQGLTLTNLLKKCNAITVLAHPVRMKKNRIEDIINMGIDGIEAVYSINTLYDVDSWEKMEYLSDGCEVWRNSIKLHQKYYVIDYALNNPELPYNGKITHLEGDDKYLSVPAILKYPPFIPSK